MSRITSDYKIQLLNSDGTVNKTYNLAVIGDCNGDGRVTATDTSALKAIVKAKYEKNALENLIADVDCSGRTTATDKTALVKLVKIGYWN